MDHHTIPDINLREALSRRGLTCQLLMPTRTPVDGDPSFETSLSRELHPITLAAYKRLLTPAHLLHETWAVAILETEAPNSVVACATLGFSPGYPCCFQTRFEAVHPDRQRTGLGRALYDCIAVWARFLVFSDPIVRHMVVRAAGEYCLVSTIDRDDDDEADMTDDNAQGHGTFLKKLGFVRALHDFDTDADTEIAFQRAFAIPELTEPDDE